jgi:hypothetical protein
MTRPLVLYHAFCTDGFCAAFELWRRYGDAADYKPVDYVKSPEYRDGIVTSCVGRELVYMVDFSLPLQNMRSIRGVAGRFIHLDHHKSAFEELGFEDYYVAGSAVVKLDSETGSTMILDSNRSGAMLTWQFINDTPNVPYYVRLVDDRDRWKFEYLESRAFHAFMQSKQPWTFEGWKAIVDDAVAFEDAILVGKALVEYMDASVRRIARKPISCNIAMPHGPAKGLAVNSSILQSEVGDTLNRTADYGLVWYMQDRGMVRCSIRSRGTYDVSAIARHYGGGGHLNAAGFEVTLEMLNTFLKETYENPS